MIHELQEARRYLKALFQNNDVFMLGENGMNAHLDGARSTEIRVAFDHCHALAPSTSPCQQAHLGHGGGLGVALSAVAKEENVRFVGGDIGGERFKSSQRLLRPVVAEKRDGSRIAVHPWTSSCGPASRFSVKKDRGNHAQPASGLAAVRSYPVQASWVKTSFARETLSTN